MQVSSKIKITHFCLSIFCVAVLIFGLYTNVVAEETAHSLTQSKLEAAALERVGQTMIYDGSYQKLKYPMGDVENNRGVCTDVVIRSFRKLGIDLQQLVHEDMQQNFSSYPNNWGLDKPDKNIDHRRVPNLRRFFERHAKSFEITNDPKDYKVGDIVSWKLLNNAPHIGMVISHYSYDGKRPLIVHNIGAGTVVEDVLFDYEITGHYQYLPEVNVFTE